MKIQRKNEYEITIPRQDDMLVDATIYASARVKLEESSILQLAAGAAIPTIRRALATPDIHLGYGVPIGSVLGLEGVIVPVAVGFDINCGMRVLTTNINADFCPVEEIAIAIRREIPLGEGKSNVALSKKDLDIVLAQGIKGLFEISRSGHPVWDFWEKSQEKTDLKNIESEGSLNGKPGAVSDYAKKRGLRQLATLGGGNHFIEFQKVESIIDSDIAEQFGLFAGQLLIMIHSGSRGLGHQVGDEYMRLARKKTDKSHRIPFLDMEKKEGKQYFGAMNAAANYAFTNRHLMALMVKSILKKFIPDVTIQLLYDVPHNIAKKEKHKGRELYVHRKGATRAFGPDRMRGTRFATSGQPVVIPGSMGTSSYILSGLDAKADNLGSVNHGAGRAMSRSAARGKKKGNQTTPPAITQREFKDAMGDVFLICENKKRIIEEAPQAYKDIDVVMETVLGANLANGVIRSKPLAVLKG